MEKKYPIYYGVIVFLFQAELPYVARAKALRHELAESGSVEEKLAAKNKELQDARRSIKLKVY